LEADESVLNWCRPYIDLETEIVEDKPEGVVLSGDPLDRSISEKIGMDFFFRKPVELDG